MSYVLEPKVKAELEKLRLGADVERVSVGVAQDHEGEDVLAFEVVIKDELAFSTAAREAGKRLAEIEMELRDRAARAGVPLFALVNFLAHSEQPRRTKKSA